jgi:hypothetical protein
VSHIFISLSCYSNHLFCPDLSFHSILPVFCTLYCFWSTLNMEAAGYYRMLVHMYQSTQCHPMDLTLHQHHWEPQILQHDASWYSVLVLQSHHLILETDTEQHYHRGKVPNVKEISYCIIKMCVIFSVGGSRIIGWCDFNSLLLGCAIYSPPYLANVTYVTFAAK